MLPRKRLFAPCALMCFGLLGIAQPRALAQPPAAPAAGVSDDLLRQLAAQYVPAEAAIALMARPQATLTRPGMEMLPHEVITAAGMKDMGIDPMQIDAVVACVGVTANGPPIAGVVIHMATPLPPAEQMSGLLKDTEPAEHAGKKYFRATSPMAASFYMADKQTFIVALEPMMALMMDAKKDSPLRALLAKAALKSDVSVIAALDQMRDLINMARAQAGEVPPPFVELMKIPDHIQFAQATVDLQRGYGLRLALVSQDEPGAKELVRLLNMAMALGKQMLLQQMASQPASDDPVEQAGQKYALRMIDFYFNALTPRQQGKRVEIGYQVDSGMATTGILVALLLPALQTAREAARRAQTTNNLKQICLALLNYEATYRTFPAAESVDANGKPLLSWRVHILPYIEQAQLYKQFKLDEPWDSEHNAKLIPLMPQAYVAPGVELAEPGTTVYVAPVSEWSILAAKPRRIRDIVDGTSNTILVLEANPEAAVIWTKPQDLDVTPEDPARGLGAVRPSGLVVAFGDGRVDTIPHGEFGELWNLFTINDQAAPPSAFGGFAPPGADVDTTIEKPPFGVEPPPEGEVDPFDDAPPGDGTPLPPFDDAAPPVEEPVPGQPE